VFLDCSFAHARAYYDFRKTAKPRERPLRAHVIGYSQVLKRTLPPGTAFLEQAEEIEKAGQRAASLTRQLLAFSRQQVLAPAVLNINSLMSEMEKMLPRLMGEDIEIVIALDPAIGRVKADHGQLEQVVMNLAVNARDAMPDGGKVVITTANAVLDEAWSRLHPGSKAGDFVMLSVADTGTGIDSETLAHIFEPFFTTKERGKGTGLGLATVYGVVKQSGGYVWVVSALGKGTSFEIYLPRIEELVSVPEPVAPVVEALRGAETILLVEDADALRKLTHMLLEQHGYRVLVAPKRCRSTAVGGTKATAHQPAAHRCDHARSERSRARWTPGTSPARPEDSVHVRLYGRRDHGSRRAGIRHAFAAQTFQRREPDPQSARSVGRGRRSRFGGPCGAADSYQNLRRDCATGGSSSDETTFDRG